MMYPKLPLKNEIELEIPRKNILSPLFTLKEA